MPNTISMNDRYRGIFADSLDEVRRKFGLTAQERRKYTEIFESALQEAETDLRLTMIRRISEEYWKQDSTIRRERFQRLLEDNPEEHERLRCWLPDVYADATGEKLVTQ